MKNTNTNSNGNNIVLIKRLAELGLTDTEIAHALNMKAKEFREMKEKKLVSSALAKGRDNLDRQVEHALFHRATGFEYEEITEAKSESTGTTKSSESKKGGTTKSVMKHVIPDVTACIFWLKNRHPDKWHDPKDIESGDSLKEMIEMYDDENEDTR
jgi:hypothetical protein